MFRRPSLSVADVEFEVFVTFIGIDARDFRPDVAVVETMVISCFGRLGSYVPFLLYVMGYVCISIDQQV